MGRTVLTVDDEAQTRDFISTVLEEIGYTPLLAENGDEAMDIVRQNKPDLIILDIMMPKQSGIKMYRELKRAESLKDIPVIVCSGLPKRTYLRAQAALTESSGESVPDPDAYLEKPVTPGHLEATIKKIIG